MGYGTDQRIDPLTGDYDGTRISDLSNAIYLRIVTPLGSWWGDPALGSKLHLLRREKDVPRIRVLAEQYTREALQPILDDGRADRLDVVTEWPGAGRLNLLCSVFQAGELVATFSHPVQVS